MRRLLAVAAFALLCAGCAELQKAAPTIRTIYDVALEECRAYYGAHPEALRGYSVREACDDAESLAPFIDVLLKARGEAGRKSAAHLAAHPRH